MSYRGNLRLKGEETMMTRRVSWKSVEVGRVEGTFPVEQNGYLFQETESQPSCEYQKVLIARGKKKSALQPKKFLFGMKIENHPCFLLLNELTHAVYLDCFFIPRTFGHGQCFQRVSTGGYPLLPPPGYRRIPQPR